MNLLWKYLKPQRQLAALALLLAALSQVLRWWTPSSSAGWWTTTPTSATSRAAERESAPTVRPRMDDGGDEAGAAIGAADPPHSL